VPRPVARRPTMLKSLLTRGHGKVVGVSAGPAHSLAVTEEGAVYSWGVSKEGVLGRGLDSSTFRLNVSIFLRDRVHLGVVDRLFRGSQGVSGCM